MTLPNKHDVRRARKAKRESDNRRAPDAWQAIAEHFKLTAMELQVLKLLLDGSSDKRIAKLLGRSRWDANKHVQNLRAKFGVHSRMEIAAAIRDFLREATGEEPLTPPLN